jgi:hypothetical protein
MMPHHRNMVRGQCRIVESTGGGVARHALTVRLSPKAGREAELRSNLEALLGTLSTRPGLVGAHLLKHDTPPIATTKEQQIRAVADQVADWVFVAIGYDAVAMKQLAETELSTDSLIQAGGMPGLTSGLYALSYSATPGDVALRLHGS